MDIRTENNLRKKNKTWEKKNGSHGQFTDAKSLSFSKTYSVSCCVCETALRVSQTKKLSNCAVFHIVSNQARLKSAPKDCMAWQKSNSFCSCLVLPLVVCCEHDAPPHCRVGRDGTVYDRHKGFCGPESNLTSGFNTMVMWSLTVAVGRAATLAKRSKASLT